MGEIQRAIFGSLDAHDSEQILPRGGARRQSAAEFPLRTNEIFFEPSREFARDTNVRKAVGTIGRDLYVEHRVAWGQDGVDRRAECGTIGENHQASSVFGDAQFFGGAHHAVG